MTKYLLDISSLNVSANVSLLSSSSFPSLSSASESSLTEKHDNVFDMIPTIQYMIATILHAAAAK